MLHENKGIYKGKKQVMVRSEVCFDGEERKGDDDWEMKSNFSGDFKGSGC